MSGSPRRSGMNAGTRRLRWLLLATFCAAFPAAAADVNKVLHVAFVAPENGFDPQATGDLYSNYVNREIFDPLYRYDYLARPYKVVPNTAAALPEISSDGLTWTIKVRPGIYFTDDAAFKGKKRELAAADYVYSWKRLLDPKLRSINAQTFDDRLFGAKAAIEAAKKTGKFDYDAPMEGAQAIDRYTIRLKLNYPAYDLLADLTGSGTSAVAREVITAYGDPSGWNMDHPVGGGYTPDKIALRRAVSMAYNNDDEIHIIRLDQAQVATQPIPPNVTGHDPAFKGNPTHDVAGAKALLDKFGYVDRDGDGWRDLPGGKPLKLVLAWDPSATYRQFDQLWKRSMDAIGIRIEFTKQKFPDTLKQGVAGQLQMWGLANTATNTSGGTFFDLLYGPHTGTTNLSRFDLPEFNALYDKAERLPDGPERAQLYKRMS